MSPNSSARKESMRPGQDVPRTRRPQASPGGQNQRSQKDQFSGTLRRKNIIMRECRAQDGSRSNAIKKRILSNIRIPENESYSRSLVLREIGVHTYSFSKRRNGGTENKRPQQLDFEQKFRTGMSESCYATRMDRFPNRHKQIHNIALKVLSPGVPRLALEPCHCLPRCAAKHRVRQAVPCPQNFVFVIACGLFVPLWRARSVSSNCLRAITV